MASGESSFTGDPGRYVKKGSGCGHFSPWGPLFQGEPGMWGGGLYTRDFDRRALVVGLLSARDSMKGTLREGSFTGEPER